MRDTKKMLGDKIVYFKKFHNFGTNHFFIEAISYLFFIKNVFIKIINSIFPPKYTGYGKNIKEQNCLFQKVPHL